ncbi:MAG TPA: ABC transporter permease subunit [Streptosporangiaceae bacterium]
MAAVAGQQLAGELAPVPPRVRTGAVRRFPFWRWIILVLAGLYFALPLYAGFRFSGLSSFPAVASQEGFSEAFTLSIRLAAITTVLTLVLMVPTVIWVHLRLPKVRRIMETITILPIVIPPVVLILGVLEVSPAGLKASPNLLALLYVVLAMPFAYRALDAGLRALDLKTLVEASNSLGGGMGTTLWRIILPNLRTALLSATVLTVALVLGEFTMASLDQYQTFPVWIVAFDQTSGPISVAASLAALIVTWIVLMLITAIGGRGRGGRGSGATLYSVARREPPGGS